MSPRFESGAAFALREPAGLNFAMLRRELLGLAHCGSNTAIRNYIPANLALTRHLLA